MLIKNIEIKPKSTINFEEINDDQTFGFVMISDKDLEPQNTNIIPSIFDKQFNKHSQSTN